MVKKIKVNGKWLALPAGFKISIERHNSAMHPGKIFGVFAFNLQIPVTGNEQILNFAHAKETARDFFSIKNVELWHFSRVYYGELILHASQMDKYDGNYEADFSGTGFLIDVEKTLISDLDLPTYNLGETQEEIRDAAKAACTADVSPFRFPLFRNDSFYREEENPIDFLDATGAKIENRVGIINRYDTVEQEFPENVVDLDYYLENPGSSARKNVTTLVPWFHLLEVLRQVVIAMGYKAKGTLFGQTELDKVLLTSNQSIDKTLPKTNYARVGVWDSIWNISQYFYSELIWGELHQWYLLDTSDEASGYFEDHDNRHAHAVRIYTVPGDDGVFIRAEIRFSNGILAAHTFVFICRAVKWNGSEWVTVQTKYQEFSKGLGVSTHKAILLFNIPEADAPSGTQIRIEIADMGGIGITATPLAIHPIHYVDYEFIDIESTLMGINVHDGLVEMKNHIPKMSIKNFLLNMKDLFNLDITPNHEKRILTFDLAQDQLSRQAIPIDSFVSTEFRKLFRKPKAFNFQFTQESFVGYPLPAKVNFTEPDWQNYVFRYGDVRFDTRTQRFYILVYEDGLEAPLRIWEDKGEDETYLFIGDEKGAVTEVTSGINPVEMCHIDNYQSATRRVVIPRLEEYGSKPSQNIVGTNPKPAIAIWHGMQPDSEGDNYPFASPFHLNYDGDVMSALALRWNTEIGLGQLYWRKWAEFLNAASEFETKIIVPEATMELIFRNKKISWGGQEFIISETNEESVGEMVKANLIVKRIEPS